MNLIGRDGIQVKNEQELNDAINNWANNHEKNKSYRVIKLSGKRFVDDEIYDIRCQNGLLRLTKAADFHYYYKPKEWACPLHGKKDE